MPQPPRTQKAFLEEASPDLGAEEKALAMNQVKKCAKHQRELKQRAAHFTAGEEALC